MLQVLWHFFRKFTGFSFVETGSPEETWTPKARGTVFAPKLEADGVRGSVWTPKASGTVFKTPDR